MRWPGLADCDGILENAAIAPANARSNRLKTIIAFAAGFAATIAIIAFLPTSRDARYAALGGDARQLTRVYGRVTADPKPIDVAFLGSSRTMTGVDDKGVETGLAAAGLPLSVANLAVPDPGRDLELILAKLLVTYKSPKLIVIELDQYEVPYGHRLVPYVGDLADIFCCKEYLNYAVAGSLLHYLRTQLWGAWAMVATSSQDTPLASSTYNWMPWAGGWDETQERNLRILQNQDNGVRGALKLRYIRWATPFGLDAIRRIAELAGERGTKVAFLYVPTLYNIIAHDGFENSEFYRSLGTVMSVPESIAVKDRYWHDAVHLNPAGAERLIPDLVEDIAHLGIVPGKAETGGLRRDMRSGPAATSNDSQIQPAKGT
jgi:hypothetical protein